LFEVGERVDVVVADEAVLVLGAVAEEDGEAGDGFDYVAGWGDFDEFCGAVISVLELIKVVGEGRVDHEVGEILQLGVQTQRLRPEKGLPCHFELRHLYISQIRQQRLILLQHVRALLNTMKCLLTENIDLTTLLIRRDLRLHLGTYLILQIVHNALRTGLNLIRISLQRPGQLLHQLLHHLTLAEYERTPLNEVLTLLELGVFAEDALGILVFEERVFVNHHLYLSGL